MHGNLPEWCLDVYPLSSALTFSQFAYAGVAITNPVAVFVPAAGGNSSYAITRGGGYYSKAPDCRSARRQLKLLTDVVADIGFRVVLSPTNAAVLP